MVKTRNQFRICWKHNSKQYVPDFVAETEEAIYMIETKQERDLGSEEVQEKAAAALGYCRYATEHMTTNRGKPWKYIIIPHSEVLFIMGFDTLAWKYECTN